MDGTISNGRIFGEEPGGKDDGVPDGVKVDEQDNILVTGPRGIWVWDKSGRRLGTIVMPEQPANLITATASVFRLRTKTHGFVPYLPFSKIEGRKP
jgi:gluconolactonase